MPGWIKADTAVYAENDLLEMVNGMPGSISASRQRLSPAIACDDGLRLLLLGAVGAVGVMLRPARRAATRIAVCRPGCFVMVLDVTCRPAGHPESSGQFLGIMLVYLGIAVLLGAWLETIRTTRTGSRVELRQLLLVLLAWAAPILLAPPLFSRDVYSYAAQGQMVSKGLDPYLHGPSVLGGGRFLTLVDPLWRHATAPYGPAWERLSGWVVELSGHRVLWAVVGFRLVAVIGLALLAWGFPALARAVGRSATIAFTVAVLNPLVLLVLLGGAHNDALMLGLLVLGCAPAARRHALAGLACCALAAEVKAPALIAVIFIGWAWWGAGQDLRQRACQDPPGRLLHRGADGRDRSRRRAELAMGRRPVRRWHGRFVA